MNKFNISIVIVFMFFAGIASAQKELKYKEVYEFVNQPDTILCYEMMKAFQKQDPYHANSYYQLGLISYAWSKKYDPLTQPFDVRYFIYHTKVYFNLAKTYIDDKEIRKNREYYQGISVPEGEKLSMEQVITEIEKRLKDNSEYSENFELIYRNYTKSVEFYNKAVKLFLEINTNNTKQKELLLTVTNDLKNKISDLETSFDSAVYYLDAFVENIHNYPIKNYKQEYTIRPIETYRLEGLTYSNFLNNDISLWNFKQWAQKFNNILNTDISDIRNKIDSTYTGMESINARLKTEAPFSDSLAEINIDPKVLFKIGKYDYNSIIINFFNAIQAKSNFLRYYKKTFNNPADSTEIELKKKAFYYNKLLENKLQTDKLYENTKANITPEGLEKYRKFIDDNFSGNAGFEQKLTNELNDNNSILNESFDNYKQFIVRAETQNYTDTVLKYGKYQIALYKNNKKKELDIDETYTEAIALGAKNEKYVSGKVNVSGNEKAFVCLVNKNSIKWFKTFEHRDSDKNTGILVEDAPRGCFLILSSIEASNTINTLIRLDHNGHSVSEYKLLENKVPRYIKFDEINETILLAFYGNKRKSQEPLMSELQIALYNTETKITPAWAQTAKLEVRGAFVDIAKINENLYVFVNFHEYKNINSQSMFVPDSNSPEDMNAMLIMINSEGSIVKMLPYLSGSHYFMLKAVKIDNNLINLVGLKGSSGKALKMKEKQKGELHYMLIDNEGNLKFSN